MSRARHDVVTTREGARAIRDLALGEVMHPVVGPAVEAEQLYVAQSHLRDRLLGDDPFMATSATNPGMPAMPKPGPGRAMPVVLFDAGLGAGSNALAARRVSEQLAGSAARTLEIVSFENDLGSLELALQPENAAAFSLEGEPGEAARALLERGFHETPRTLWRLRHGDLLEQLALETQRADLVYWDPFSPRATPALWTVRAFAALRARCGAHCTLYTYAAATSVRSALLLAGFAVGIGAGTGTTRETTAAACDVRDLQRPLDQRWLQRLARSSAPFPADAPANALDLVRAYPQFQ